MTWRMPMNRSPPRSPKVSCLASPLPEVQEALGLLLEAYDTARDTKRDVWEFAVELRALARKGVTNTALRWLICCGYAEHAVEKIDTLAEHRALRQLHNLSLPGRACFVLTPSGA